MKKLTVIFDLDGTLALIDKRRAKALKLNGKLNWGEFFKPENIQLDEPNIPVIKTFQSLKQSGFEVGIFSGRDSISRKETEKWLLENGIEADFFKMRPQGSHTPDDVLKKMWLTEMISDGKEIMCVFDDRDKVVKMWRDNGISCFQVNYGDF
jgi:hypothetical protein